MTKNSPALVGRWPGRLYRSLASITKLIVTTQYFSSVFFARLYWTESTKQPKGNFHASETASSISLFGFLC